MYENPVATLKKLNLGEINYTSISAIETNGCLIFEVNLTLNGFTFKGNGFSKKKAKNEAANKALNWILLSRPLVNNNIVVSNVVKTSKATSGK